MVIKEPKNARERSGGGTGKFGLWFDDRKIAIGITVLFLLTMIPMLVVAGYSHASADDFGWGRESAGRSGMRPIRSYNS